MIRKDLRTKKTDAAIRLAFMRLVEERGFARVSVKDICERADINRNTFYLHYPDKETLVERMLNELMTAQAAPIAQVVGHLSAAAPDAVEQVVRNILGVLKEEIAFYRILFTDDGLYKYVRPLERTAYRLILNGATRPISRVTLDYIISGFVGVVTSWMTDKRGTIDDVAPVLTRLLAGNLRELHIGGGEGDTNAPVNAQNDEATEIY